jgi:hypothetical protein
MHPYDGQARHAGMIYMLMLVIAVAFGGFVWQLYSAPEIPRITAPAGPYKVAPPPEAANAPDEIEQSALDAAEAPALLRGPTTPDADVAPPAPAPAQPAAPPRILGNGPYVAQLAALQSEAAVDQAWRRLSSQAPQLFSAAHLDVERADLGPRGVYFRVRAGYFPDRGEAARFCDRIRRMGQDCIVVAR